MALPIEALKRIIQFDAVTHLPDQVAPTLHFDAAAQVHLGRDDVNDIFILDESDQIPTFDTLVNWDVGEDLVVITNHTSLPLASEDSQIGVRMRVCQYGQDRTHPGSS
jgi:hypothetical protein